MDRGFCPGPADYRFNGNAFVFSLQATALNPPLGLWFPCAFLAARKAQPDDPVPYCVAPRRICSELFISSGLQRRPQDVGAACRPHEVPR